MNKNEFFQKSFGEINKKLNSYFIVILYLISILLLLYAPNLMPESYNWIEHTTSESAAQGISGAWMARLGFIIFGMAVLWQSQLLKSQWSRASYICFIAFGISMISTAAFAIKPWDLNLPFDKFEDNLHTVGSNLVGFSFSLGVLTVLFQRKKNEILSIIYDLIALLSAVIIPLMMFNIDGIAGVAQRSMFTIAFIWYIKETVKGALNNK